METLGIRDSTEDCRNAMEDGVHLKAEHLDTLADCLIKRAEEHFVSRKRGPTEKPGQPDKRNRVESEGAARGGWTGGRGVGPRGGRGGGRGGSWGGPSRPRSFY